MSDIESTAPVEVAAPVAAIVATPESPPTAEVTDAPPEGESPEAAPEKTLTQSEVNKIVQKEKAQASRRAEKLVEARLRAEYAERERDALQAKLNPQPAQPSGEPTPAQFQDYETYIKALTDFRVNEALKGVRKESEAQQQERAFKERAAAIRPKVEAAKAKYDDFDEVAYSYDAPPAMQAAMLKSAHTGELYYYLGANPDERERIAAMDDFDQAYAIRDLERTLTAPPSPTKTPAPIVPNNGKSSVSKKPTDMNYDEFAEYRRKRLAAKRR